MTFTYFYTIINKDLDTGLTDGGHTAVQINKTEFYYLNCMKLCQAFLEQSWEYS